jgi:hypothetical protein
MRRIGGLRTCEIDHAEFHNASSAVLNCMAATAVPPAGAASVVAFRMPHNARPERTRIRGFVAGLALLPILRMRKQLDYDAWDSRRRAARLG